MKLVVYGDPTDYALGSWTDAGILDLGRAAEELGFETTLTARSFFARGSEALADVRAAAEYATAHPSLILAEADLRLGPAVPFPGKILCIGLNYRTHAIETGLDLPVAPIVFSKFANALAAHDQPVVLPQASAKVDYEGELAVVIGTRARDIAPEQALGVVLGYATANDVSARDVQMRTSQWLLGKTMAGFLPIGPYLVTADDVADPGALSLRTWLNGKIRQDSNTSDLIFDVPFLISYLSRHLSLEPGDVILTGTPAGVIAGMSDPVWLADGDVVAIEISGLGKLENRFVTEAT